MREKLAFCCGVRRFLAKPNREKLYSFRFRLKRAWNLLFPFVPLPVRLPYGGWWLARNDVCSDAVFTGNFEEMERCFVERFLRAGMTVLDIGAHNGFYTMLASRRVGKTGRVIAFEPSPRERERLLLHLRINRLSSNVTICSFALARENGESSFFVVDGRDTGCNSLRPPMVGEATEKLTVPTTSLDGFLSETKICKVDFIKMDAEGAELDVLEGAAELLGRQPRPVILIELADSRSSVWGHSASAVVDFLVARGYRWFEIAEHGILSPFQRAGQLGMCLAAFPTERLAEAAYVSANS